MNSMTNENVEWGAVIPVEGKRPEWLFGYRGNLGYERKGKGWFGPGCMWRESDITDNDDGWASVIAIRLPANHPHYATPTRTALEQRMEDFVRRVAMLNLQSASLTGTPAWNVGKEAAELRAELPEPVDGDLLEARKIVAEGVYPTQKEATMNGEHDLGFYVQTARTAIKRGRALERGE